MDQESMNEPRETAGVCHESHHRRHDNAVEVQPAQVSDVLSGALVSMSLKSDVESAVDSSDLEALVEFRSNSALRRQHKVAEKIGYFGFSGTKPGYSKSTLELETRVLQQIILDAEKEIQEINREHDQLWKLKRCLHELRKRYGSSAQDQHAGTPDSTQALGQVTDFLHFAAAASVRRLPETREFHIDYFDRVVSALEDLRAILVHVTAQDPPAQGPSSPPSESAPGQPSGDTRADASTAAPPTLPTPAGLAEALVVALRLVGKQHSLLPIVAQEREHDAAECRRELAVVRATAAELFPEDWPVPRLAGSVWSASSLAAKGFGFLRADGCDDDVFFHLNELGNRAAAGLALGQRVTFTLAEGPAGEARAVHVRPAASSSVFAGVVADAASLRTRGFGFIRAEGWGTRVFFSVAGPGNAAAAALTHGQRVGFTIAPEGRAAAAGAPARAEAPRAVFVEPLPNVWCLGTVGCVARLRTHGEGYLRLEDGFQGGGGEDIAFSVSGAGNRAAAGLARGQRVRFSLAAAPAPPPAGGARRRRPAAVRPAAVFILPLPPPPTPFLATGTAGQPAGEAPVAAEAGPGLGLGSVRAALGAGAFAGRVLARLGPADLGRLARACRWARHAPGCERGRRVGPQAPPPPFPENDDSEYRRREAGGRGGPACSSCPRGPACSCSSSCWTHSAPSRLAHPLLDRAARSGKRRSESGEDSSAWSARARV